MTSTGDGTTKGGATAASPGFISLAEAARRGRCHVSVVQRLALAGAIRTRLSRGRVVYCEQDVGRQFDVD